MAFEPVIFLAFANDQDEHLPILDEERKIIQRHLISLENQQYLQLFVEPNASIDSIAEYLREFQDRISIFHFSGHANSSKFIDEALYGNQGGIVELLAAQDNLNLVFLNGVATVDQVRLLHDAGIPLVLATNVGIMDAIAKEFSDIFYRSLANDYTIEEAFHASASYLQMKGEEKIEIYHNYYNRDSYNLAWGLYVTDEGQKYLDWKIPKVASNVISIGRGGERFRPDISVESLNKDLVTTIANTISPFSKEIIFYLEKAKLGNSPQFRDLRRSVIDAFPSPIGNFLRKIIISKDLNTNYLKRILDLYQFVISFLTITLVSQLWDEILKDKKIQISERLSEDLSRAFDERSRGTRASYFNADLLQKLLSFFSANRIEPFMSELEELWQLIQSGDSVFSAFRFFESLDRQLTIQRIAPEEISSYCIQANAQLRKLTEDLGFLARYTMATTKTIEVKMPIAGEPKFSHNLVFLNNVTAGLMDDVQTSESHLHNNAVVLLKGENNFRSFLNLTPFIIDENALNKSLNSKLFILQYRERGSYVYQFIDNLEDVLQVNEDNYPEVKEAIEFFTREISRLK